jgi:hypothetical protein
MPGFERDIPDYTEDMSYEEYERYERERLEQARPEVLSPEEIEDFFRDVPF